MEENEIIKIHDMNRINNVDILKGFGIVFMIFGHVYFGEYFDIYIHAFHMPLFILISGYFFRCDNITFKKFISKKIKTLIIPYSIFGIFHYCIWVILIGVNRESNIVEPLYNLLWVNTNLNMPIAGALWFLTCLFIIELIFFTMKKYIKKNSNFNTVIICILTVGAYFSKITSIRLPYGIDTALIGVGFFYVGYLIRKYENRNKIVNKLMNLNLLQTYALLLLNIPLIFMNGLVNMRTIIYNNIILFFINSIIAIIGYWNLAKYIEKSKCAIVESIGDVLLSIGRNSIVYLVLNQITILCLYKFTSITISNNGGIMYLMQKIMVFIGTFIFLKIISIVFIKTKLRIIIGK